MVLAAEKGNFEIFEILLSHKKIDVNMMSIIFDETQKNSYRFIVKCAPLHIAIKTQNYKIIKLLLNIKDTDINALYEKCFIYYKIEKLKQYKTPLCVAIENKDDEMIKILLDSKRIELIDALVNIGNKNDTGCLHTFSLKIKQKPDILPMSHKQKLIEKKDKMKKLPFFLFEYISAKEAYHKINSNNEFKKFDKEFDNQPNNSFFDTDVDIEDENSFSSEEEEEYYYY